MTPEERALQALAIFDAAENLTPSENKTLLESIIASAIREAETLAAQRAAFQYGGRLLSSEELKLVDKHCDWPAFGHAFSAVMKSRSLKSKGTEG